MGIQAVLFTMHLSVYSFAQTSTTGASVEEAFAFNAHGAAGHLWRWPCVAKEPESSVTGAAGPPSSILRAGAGVGFLVPAALFTKQPHSGCYFHRVP